MTTDTTAEPWFGDAVIPNGVPVPGGEENSDTVAETSEGVSDAVLTLEDRLDRLDARLDSMEGILDSLNARVTAVLTTVDSTLKEVTPFLESLSTSKIGKMLGIGDGSEKDTIPPVKTKRGFF